MDAYVEVLRADGSSERHRIEGEQMTLGRSPAAGITVTGVEELEPEHLLVAPRSDGCWVAIAKGARIGAVVRGTPFEHGLLAWGSEVEIGTVRLRVSNTAPGAVKDQQVSPPVAIAALVGIAVLGWLLLGDDGGELPETAAAPPPLFGEAAPCGAEGPAALHAAREAAEAAAAKSERYVFSAQDGVTAVTLYARAEACFGRSGAAADARRMATEREAMTRRIDEDYKTHRLRLERSLHHARFPEALVEAHAIRALTEHLEGPYVDWLTLLERRLQMLVDKANLKAAGGQ
jgi:hypothetical protein